MRKFMFKTLLLGVVGLMTVSAVVAQEGMSDYQKGRFKDIQDPDSTGTLSDYSDALKSKSSQPVPFEKGSYFGFGGGVSLGVATFGSIGEYNTNIGYNANMFYGYEFSRLISAEVALSYTSLKMTTCASTQNYYYSLGDIVFYPSDYAIALGEYYKFPNLESNVNLYTVEAKVNFDMMAFSSYPSRFGLLLTPKIGCAISDSQLEDVSGIVLRKQTAAHFSAGIDISAVYAFSSKLKLRLTTGATHYTGDGIDAVPQFKYESNYTWTTNLNLIFKF